MSNFFNKAISNFGGTYANAIIPTTVADSLTQSKGINGNITVRNADSATVIAQTRTIVQAQPSTTVDPNLLNGGTIDFRIEKGMVDVLDHIYIIISVTNSTGSSCTIQPSQLLFDRWELYADNGNRLLFQKYAHEMWLDNVYFSRNEWEVMDEYLLSNASYSTAGTAIANGASLTFYTPLVSFFTPLKLNIGGLSGQLLLRLRFDTSTLNMIAGSTPTTTACTAQLRGRMLPQRVKEEKNRTYMTLNYDMPYLGIQRMSLQQTLAVSSTYSIVLSGLKGICSTVFFVVRALPFTAANQASYIQMTSFYLQEQDGSSMLGFYRRQYADMQLEIAESFNNLFTNYVNLHMIIFTSSPVSDYIYGTNNGYQALTSFEKLSFTTPSTITPGSFQIDIWASTHEFAMVRQGVLSTTRNN